jgi:hypothetical protein
MANYDVQITRSLRFSVGRKWNEVVVKRSLRFSVKKRRDDWLQNFGGSSVGWSGGTVRRKMRFRFP